MNISVELEGEMLRRGLDGLSDDMGSRIARVFVLGDERRVPSYNPRDLRHLRESKHKLDLVVDIPLGVDHRKLPDVLQLVEGRVQHARIAIRTREQCIEMKDFLDRNRFESVVLTVCYEDVWYFVLPSMSALYTQSLKITRPRGTDNLNELLSIVRLNMLPEMKFEFADHSSYPAWYRHVPAWPPWGEWLVTLLIVALLLFVGPIEPWKPITWEEYRR